MDKSVSYNMGNNVLFDGINYGENFLILYNNTFNHRKVFSNFVKGVMGDNPIVVYTAHTSNPLKFGYDCKSLSFNIINENVLNNLKIKLNKYFIERERSNSKMVLIFDWSPSNVSNCQTFKPFLENLIQKTDRLYPPLWKKKYNEKRSPFPMILINAFDTAGLTPDFTQQLISMHNKAYFLQENSNTFLLPSILPAFKAIPSEQHILSREGLEKLAKDNLELITLLFLEGGDKSGYQILKEIASHFHCVLSQGTLYPLLYQLQKGNKIAKKNGKGREVIYSLAPEMKELLKLRKQASLQAYQYLTGLFKL